MTDWQPIETAPKDGTRVLLGFEGDFLVFIGHIMDTGDGRLRILSDSWGDQFLATHWQPLPDPPNKT